MSNKSFTTKGLSRQLEDKANKLQDDLNDFREKHVNLEERFNDKSREANKLRERLYDTEQDADVRVQRLNDQNELLRHDHEATIRKCESLTKQAQQAAKELQTKSEEKDLLHSRHDALTAESQTLQKDLTKTQSKLQDLTDDLAEERQHAQDNDRQLRAEAEKEIDRLSKAIGDLQRELEDKEGKYVADQDHWDAQRRSLQSQNEKLDEQAKGLQRTISKLQETEGTLSGRELKLQEALESEKQRHKSEEEVLERQVRSLNADIEEKRRVSDDLREELSQMKEDLSIHQRKKDDLEEKLQALEDEIEVLQSSLDDEADKARSEIDAIQQEAEALRSELTTAKNRLSEAQSKHQKVGQEAEQKLRHDLQTSQEELRRIKSEKQTLQDKLAKSNLETHAQQTSLAEMEAERDEIKSQLKQMQNEFNDTYKLDQEKLDLRASKLKFESDITRLREEQKGLVESKVTIERQLDEEISRASSEEARLNEAIDDLQRKLTAASSTRDRELKSAKQRTERLEQRIKELMSLQNPDQNDGAAAELSVIQRDLDKAQKKETEYLQREAAQRDIVRELKQQVTRLERRSHELEVARLTVDSPKSSVSGSARKSEIIEMQCQLADAHQQLRDARAKSKDDLKALQRRLSESERLIQFNLDKYEQQRDQLEAEIATSKQEQESLISKNTNATQTITRLRSRISSLEKDLQTRRRTITTEDTIALERHDLHEMLKDAKLTAEDLQVQVNARDSQIATSSAREKDLRTQLKRVREERTLQTQKSTALLTELDHLQTRYGNAIDNLSRQQRSWDDERKAIASKVRFANTSVSEIHQDQELVKKHAGELKGLAKQIQWLRAKCKREEGFRNDLIFEKRFLLMRIEMFETWLVFIFHHPYPLKKNTRLTISIPAIPSISISSLKWAFTAPMTAKNPSPNPNLLASD